MSQTIPDRSVVGELALEYIDSNYDTSITISQANGHVSG